VAAQFRRSATDCCNGLLAGAPSTIRSWISSAPSEFSADRAVVLKIVRGEQSYVDFILHAGTIREQGVQTVKRTGKDFAVAHANAVKPQPGFQLFRVP
jgi:hypothetical protein